MQYGYFDDEKREYVVTRPDTPRSWSNYLGSTEYGAIITNNAGGYSFYQSAARGRFTRMRFNTIPMDQPGRYFYLRDRDNGDYWSASWQPVGKPPAQYETICRHGTGYTIIESAYAGIETESTYFVPLGRLFECWILKVTNAGNAPRSLSVFTYVELANAWDYQQDLHNLQFSQYLADGAFDGRCVCVGTKTNFPEMAPGSLGAGAAYVFLGAVGADPVGFDTDREAFLGPYRTYADPLVVDSGACTNSEVHGDNACGVLQFDLDLAGGESRELMVVLGVGHAATRGAEALAEFDSVEKGRAALAEVRTYWHDRIGTFVVDSPDDEFDSMVNVWNAYNSLITFAWSRAASLVYAGRRDGLGYRDTVQDILGVLAAIPNEARERLELMITGQVASGGAMPVVKPFEHRPGHEAPPDLVECRSDDCLWLFHTVPAYVKETGDLGFYDNVLPFADAGEGTVLEHLRRALAFNLAHRGNHGLPCGLKADWNDCLKLGTTGETLFVAFQLRLSLDTYAGICRRLDRPDEEAWAREQLAELGEAIRTHAWDGQWFVRAFRDDGSVLGSSQSSEGAIFLNPQSWAVLSGAATPEQGVTALDAVHERLASPFGIALCDPPFRATSPKIVGAVVYPPSMKENAGIFCHPQAWAVMAETILGRGDRAYEYYRAYMPSAYNTRAEVRQIEPYVHCQSTHGRHSRRFGASRLPWLSGTASWSYYAATHHILGIQPDYEGLRIDPCLPSAWSETTVERRFRGRRFRITIRNGSVGKGVESLTLNGTDVEGSLLPIEQCLDENTVEAQLK